MYITVCCLFLISSGWGGEEVGSRRGRSEGAELERENKRGGGGGGVTLSHWRGWGGGGQCGNVTLPHSSSPSSTSG
jgi:hypothetical protein